MQEQNTTPAAQIIAMASAYWGARLIHAAAQLKLADALAAGGRDAVDLATATGTHAPSLHRLMRTLASMGVLSEDSEQRFSLTPLGEALRSDAAGAALPTVLAIGSPWWMASFDQIMHSLTTGQTGFEKAMGQPLFDYMAIHPDQAELVNETMIGIHGAEPAAVCDALDFSGFGMVVDVGGGTGNLLSTILQRHPGIQGMLLDLPHVVAEANTLFEHRQVAERVTLQTGDFFHAVPSGGGAYLLSHILHDWSEEQCLTILGNCRAAMTAESRLLIVEMVLPEGNTPHPGHMLDMVMLMVAGGQERTAAEYNTLLARAGFQISRVIPTASAVSVVEATLR